MASWHHARGRSTRTIIVILAACFLWSACGSASTAQGRQPVHSTVLVPAESPDMSLGEIVSVSKSVTLQGGPLLGSVSIVNVRQDGSMVVGDFNSTRQAHLYTADGHYVRSYGKRGDTAPMPLDVADYRDSVAILYDAEVVLYDREGTRQRSFKLPAPAFSLVVVGDELCAATPYPRVGNHVVHCYGPDLSARRIFHDAFGRSVARLVPARQLSAQGSALYVLESLDPVVTVYSPAGTTRVGIPADNTLLHQQLRGTTAITRVTQSTISRQLSRFSWVCADSEGAWLAGDGPQTAALFRLDLGRQAMQRWSDALKNTSIDGWKVRMLVGCTNGALIADVEPENGLVGEASGDSEAQSQVILFMGRRKPTS